MRIATWNINSVRLRLPLLARLSETFAPDVICLQETKVIDDSFPRNEIESLGYGHIAIHGMKGYNGVAILSRQPLELLESRAFCGREDCRHVAVRTGGVELHSLYVPSGGDAPDPAANDKFAHKLDFLDELTTWSKALRRQARPLMVVGDFNVAPLETDVWSHKQLLTVVSHTPIEVEKLNRAQAAGEWVDAVRRFIPPDERLYSWWSYILPRACGTRRSFVMRADGTGRRTMFQLSPIWRTDPYSIAQIGIMTSLWDCTRYDP
jgi:exodeoxyribonuclease-3